MEQGLVDLDLGCSAACLGSRVANHKKFEDRLKLGAIAQLGDVSKGAAYSKMATAKLGWVGEIVWAIAPNFRRSSKLLVVCRQTDLPGLSSRC